MKISFSASTTQSLKSGANKEKDDQRTSEKANIVAKKLSETIIENLTLYLKRLK